MKDQIKQTKERIENFKANYDLPHVVKAYERKLKELQN